MYKKQTNYDVKWMCASLVRKGTFIESDEIKNINECLFFFVTSVALKKWIWLFLGAKLSAVFAVAESFLQ